MAGLDNVLNGARAFSVAGRQPKINAGPNSTAPGLSSAVKAVLSRPGRGAKAVKPKAVATPSVPKL